MFEDASITLFQNVCNVIFGIIANLSHIRVQTDTKTLVANTAREFNEKLGFVWLKFLGSVQPLRGGVVPR